MTMFCILLRNKRASLARKETICFVDRQTIKMDNVNPSAISEIETLDSGVKTIQSTGIDLLQGISLIIH